MSRAIYATVVQCRDTLAGAETTLYFATEALNTIGTDTPAHTHFSPRLRQPVSVRRDMFSPGRTRGRSTVSVGDTILANDDGALDYLDDYAFDGYTITTYRGEPGAAFPAGYEVVWTSTMRDGESDEDDFVLRIRDAQTALDGLIQATHFDGDNVLPAGLEGGADIEGEPKPWGFGIVRNANPPLVNSSKLIYQVHDGAVDDIAMVFDSGVPIIPQGSLTLDAVASMDAGGARCAVWSDVDAQFVIASGGAANQIFTSPDGDAWTQRTVDDRSFNGILFSRADGLYVAAGSNNASSAPYIATSPDGVTWTERTSNFAASGVIHDVAVGPGGAYVAVGTSGDVIISSDGTTWAQATDNLPGGFRSQAVVAAFGNFYAATDDGDIHESTDDGDTWAEVYAAADTLRAMIFAGGQIVAVGDSGAVVTSQDGQVWEVRSVPGLPNQITSLDYGFGYYLAGGADGYATSPDGINWRAFLPPWNIVTSSTQCVVFGRTNYGTWLVGISNVASVYVSRGAGTAYSTEAELLDDALEPLPGQFKAYLAGGLFRLGSSPAGVVTADFTVEATAAERTAARGWSAALEKFGKTNTPNVQDEDDLDAWTKTNAPTVTATDDPVGGNGAFTITDAGANTRRIQRNSVTLFTGDGQKVVEYIIRENSPASAGTGELVIIDTDDSNADRLRVQLDSYTLGEPQVTVDEGTLLSSVAVGEGYWRMRFLTSAITGANAHTWFIEPASDAAAVGALDVYRVRAYDATEVNDSWDWLDVERADATNPAECGYWTGLEYVSASTVLSAFANSIGAWWGLDRFGVLRFKIIGDPQLESNSFTFPRELDNAAWTKTLLTVTADDRLSPDGRQTMDKITEGGGSGGHFLQRSVNVETANEETLDLTFFAAADESQYLYAVVQGRDVAQRGAAFDFGAGALAASQPTSLPYARIDEVGAGIYRVFMSVRLGTGSSTPEVRLNLLNGPAWNSDDDYAGDGTSGLHVWGIRVPTGIALKIDDRMIIGRVRRLPGALPPYRHHVRYQRNHTIQDVAGLAAGVLDTRREVVARAFQEVESSDTGVQVRHLLAAEKVIDTYLDVRADAAAEGARLQEIYGVRRARYEVRIPLDAESATVDLGDIVDLRHSRYRLEAGRAFYVTAVEPDAADETLLLEVWG